MALLRPIRRGQLIAPFGVGAMVDFRGDESLMTAGLDVWPLANDNCPEDWLITEERLQQRMRVDHFRLPPDYRKPAPGVENANLRIPFVRFPRWHYCPRCGSMEFMHFYGGREKCRGRVLRGLSCSELSEYKRPFLIPVRFVTVCPKGHIEDFPFTHWVHGDSPAGNDHKLRLLASRSSAELTGMKISCVCGSSRNMGGSFNFNSETGGELHKLGYDCSGKQPWLGNAEGNIGTCGEYLRTIQRGASNVYFPVVRSAIYIPLWGESLSRELNKILDIPRVWEGLISGLDEGKYIQIARCEALASIYRVDPIELKDAAQKKFDGVSELNQECAESEEQFRRQEYEALRNGRGGTTTELMVTAIPAKNYGALFENLFSKICLIKKLRETRVLAGFTRLLPSGDDAAAELQPLALDSSLNWLPATVVRGEGIFIEFKESKIIEFCSQANVIERINILSEQYNLRRHQRGLEIHLVTPKFVLLHTLAHMLINQLSFDCGYGSAALRERIYCDSEDESNSMQGILIYTASGDSEGTLGGLVRQGEPDRFPKIIMRGIERARWCSSDPVCIDSMGQGIENSNLAACHGCMLLPETSCEEGNRMLDRALLVGKPNENDLSFF